LPHIVVLILAALAVLGTILGLVSRAGWFCELVSHFRLQYTAGLLVCAPFLFLTGDVRGATLAAGVALTNVWFLLPLYVRIRQPPGGQALRLVTANVSSLNRSHGKLQQLVDAIDPDVMVLQEVNERWLEVLGDFNGRCPCVKTVVLPGGFGLALYTRLPVERAEIIQPAPDGLPSVFAQLHLGDQRLIVVGTHPMAPVLPVYAELRNRQLTALAQFISQQTDSVILVGDLNTTPWSWVFQDFLRTAGLRDSRLGFGLQRSWPVGSRILRIPIDHCLVSPAIAVRKRRVGPDIGSDHYPIIIDIAIPG